jgi:hypothetical protein
MGVETLLLSIVQKLLVVLGPTKKHSVLTQHAMACKCERISV